ncbi:hypothetical protein TNCV_994181 [Trichonephila clavipes]|nr:hypothetical protein TNCV_994181 [Trichonephila clavipes]
MQENLRFCSHASLPRSTNQSGHSLPGRPTHIRPHTLSRYGMEERFAFRFPVTPSIIIIIAAPRRPSQVLRLAASPVSGTFSLNLIINLPYQFKNSNLSLMHPIPPPPQVTLPHKCFPLSNEKKKKKNFNTLMQFWAKVKPKQTSPTVPKIDRVKFPARNKYSDNISTYILFNYFDQSLVHPPRPPQVAASHWTILNHSNDLKTPIFSRSSQKPLADEILFTLEDVDAEAQITPERLRLVNLVQWAALKCSRRSIRLQNAEFKKYIREVELSRRTPHCSLTRFAAEAVTSETPARIAAEDVPSKKQAKWTKASSHIRLPSRHIEDSSSMEEGESSAEESSVEIASAKSLSR